MSTPPPDRSAQQARSFSGVADAYDRARPGYPADAVGWLTGSGSLSIVELGAGTGKLTAPLVGAGHDVLAVDPSVEMLSHLKRNVPGARRAVATAEAIPAPSRSVDVVVCAQSFHWFDHAVALPEIARVLRPGGRIALVWNVRDTAIPWVRKLSRIIGSQDTIGQDVSPLKETAHFGWVEQEEFRNWSTHTLESLLDLVRSRSNIAVMDEPARERVLAEVTELYAGYGRGHDGMQLPYLTECYRAVVRHQEPVAPPPAPPTQVASKTQADPDATRTTQRPPEDPGTTLIDFR